MASLNLTSFKNIVKDIQHRSFGNILVYQVTKSWFNKLTQFVEEWDQNGHHPNYLVPPIEVGVKGQDPSTRDLVPEKHWIVLVEKFGVEVEPITTEILTKYFTCPTCFKPFMTAGGLRAHRKSFHEKLRYPCEILKMSM